MVRVTSTQFRFDRGPFFSSRVDWVDRCATQLTTVDVLDDAIREVARAHGVRTAWRIRKHLTRKYEIPEEIRKNVSLSNPKVRYDKDIDTWWVTLRHKAWGSLNISSYVVYVDAKTGKIKGQRLQQQNVPVVIPIFI